MKKRLLSLLVVTVLLISLFTACDIRIAEKPKEGELTAQEAEKIALEDAGLTREQVKRLYSEYDYDDGVSRYEVQFEYEKLEYEYEIRASDGKILSFDKDRD